MKILTIACFFAILLTWTLECDGKIRVLIGSLVKKRNGYSTRGMELAEEAAKNSTHLEAFMSEYNVTIQKQGTHGTRSFAVQWAAFWFFCSEEKPLLLLGPETSKEVLSVLDITSSETKMTVAYLTAFPPNVRYGESLASTTAAFNKAKMKMMEHFGWNRAAVVYDFADNDGLYVETVVNLAKFAKFDLIGIEAINTNTELVTKSLSADTKAKLSKLKDQDTKIFFGEFGKTGASLVFCQIFKLKLFGPGFVWIIHSNAGTIEEWVNKSIKIKEKTGNNTETCTEEEYKQAAEGTFIFDKISFRRDVDTPTSSGLTVNQVFSRSTFKDIDPSDKIQVTTAFDAAWAVFLAMNETSAALTKSNLTLATNITRTNSQKRLITNTLRDALKNLNFEGLTGPVSFNEVSERQGVLVLNQMRDSGKKMVQVGQYFAKADKLQLYNDTRKTIFKDGRTPQDASQKEHEMIEVSPALFVVFCTASSIGIVLGIVFLVFNRYYRNYKFIRLSAPLFNDIIVLGCIMCLATVILFGLRNVDDPITMMPRICKARAWILTIGFTLAFGAMFIKTWRIYKICTNKRLKVRLGPLSDWWMLAMVGGVILVDALLLIAWEVVDPLQRDIYEFEPKTDPDKPYVIIIPAINTCTANNLTVWLTLLYVYKGILLLYGLFLAYETRNVVYAHLNDSRVIGICVYNTVVLSTIGAFLALILTDQQYEQLYAALSVCITFPATATISLIFIPKLVHRIKSNNLEDETGPTTMDQTARPSIDISTTMNYQTEMARDRFVDAASTNTLCVVNGEPSLSPAPSPSPPVKAVNDHVNVAVSLED